MAADAHTPVAKKSKVLVILVAVIALAASAAGGAYVYTRHYAGAAPPAPEPGIVALDPFVVNLADAGGQRFVRTTVQLVLDSRHAAEAFAKDDVGRTRVRSTVLELLTMQTAEHLVTPAGKTDLKKAIAERAGQTMPALKIDDVLFTEFVVQF